MTIDTLIVGIKTAMEGSRRLEELIGVAIGWLKEPAWVKKTPYCVLPEWSRSIGATISLARNRREAHAMLTAGAQATLGSRPEMEELFYARNQWPTIQAMLLQNLEDRKEKP